MNSARCPVAIVAALLTLTACNRRAHSDSEGSTPLHSDATAIAIQQFWQAQDRLVQTHLDGYGWINQAAGIVHIPIERAMDLIVAGKQSSGPAIDPAPIPKYRETNTDAQNKGLRLFVQYGCSVCHDPNSPSHAPSLVGIFGRRVRLSDGSFVRADDQYLHDSILHAKQQVVAGYAPVMPAYGSIIPEPDVRELIAYLKSLSPASSPIPATPP
jgi:mono/diheme cytochrome c family protein